MRTRIRPGKELSCTSATKNIFAAALPGSAGPLWAGNQALPKWTRDWRACAPLMAEHNIGVVKELIFLLEHGKLARPLPDFVNVAA